MRIALEIRIHDAERTDLLTEHGWNLLVDALNEIGAEHVEFRAVDVRAIAEKKEETR